MAYTFIPYHPEHARTILERDVRDRDVWLLQHPDRDQLLEGWGGRGGKFHLHA